MVLDKSAHHFPVAGQGADCKVFILTHKTAVFNHIGAQDGGKFTLKFLRIHDITPIKRGI
jgi:hypothetical protein